MYQSTSEKQLFRHNPSGQTILLRRVAEDVFDFLATSITTAELAEKGWVEIDESIYLGIPETRIKRAIIRTR